MNVVIPMLGNKYYSNAEFFSPKPLIEVANKTLMEYSLEFLCDFDEIQKICFVLSKDDIDSFNIDSVITRIVDNNKLKIITADGQTSGAVCTCLLTADLWNRDNELIVLSYDQLINADIAEVLTDFRKRKLDFGAISFSSIHPKWSYVLLDSDKQIVQSAEKKPISNNALAGFYYFKTADLFLELASEALLSSPGDSDVFYISELFNLAVLRSLKGSIFGIEKKDYFNFYDPVEVESFRVSFEEFAKSNDSKGIVNKYFCALNARDLHELDNILGLEVVLEEVGGTKLSGKSDVLKFVKENLFCCEKLEFQVDSVHFAQTMAFVDIWLFLDGKSYRILDVIEIFEGKIQKIKAFITEVNDAEL